jgi:hypothetical protein
MSSLPPDDLILAPSLSWLEAAIRNGLKPIQADLPAAIFRCALERYGPCAWDARADLGKNRFSAIFDGEQVVPVVYLAQHKEIALAETLFRAPPPGDNCIVMLHQVMPRLLAQLGLDRTPNIIRLDGPAASHRFGEHVTTALVQSPQYLQTRQWAQRIFEHFPDCDGLQWRSRQADHGLCWLFWQRKKHGHQLRESGDRVRLISPEGMQLLRGIAHDWGAVLDEDLDDY